MGKLYFKYGTMNSSKSLNLLSTAHSYEENGRNVLLLKPEIDTRNEMIIKSRVGLQKECITFNDRENLHDLIRVFTEYIKDVSVVFIDEVQFLTDTQIIQLAKAIDDFDINVICYGLKSDYTGHLFKATEQLMVFADDIKEIKTICRYCDKKAIMNLRVVNKKPVYKGESIIVGDIENDNEEYYIPVCRKHYFQPLL